MTSGLRAIRFEATNELRLVEQQRLDALQLALWPRATAGDVKAVLAVLRLMERRSRLLNLVA